jgi:hypothetical protein
VTRRRLAGDGRALQNLRYAARGEGRVMTPDRNVAVVHIVDDPDAAFARVVAAGAKVESPVGHQHGWRVGRGHRANDTNQVSTSHV